MAKKKNTGLRIKAEVLIVLVFFLSFILWAVSKCNAKKQDYVIDSPETTEETARAETDLAIVEEESSTIQRPQSEAAQIANEAENTTANNTVSTKIQTVYATKLYVTIDGLKLRRGPSIDSPIVSTLPLFEELTFLNEVSDSTEYISLGNDVMANEPWVRVRHWKGKEGWVYGAGVHYYKIKYPGLE